MQRFLALTIAVTAAVGTLSAGQIIAPTIQTQIGGANGLTNSYLTGAIPCAGGTGNCVTTGAVTGSNERGYDARLFQAAANGATPVNPTVDYATGTYVATPAAQTNATIHDSANNVTFSMIDDGCGGIGGTCNGTLAANNFWEIGTTGNSQSLTIPVGIFDVNDVYTMLNNIWGPQGATDTSVTFNFNTAANGSGTNTAVTFQLLNASNSVNGTGQIGTSVDCVTTTVAGCVGLANDTLSASGTLISTVGTGSVHIGYVTNNLYSQAYNTAAGVFAGSAGNVTLDDQGFIFGNAYANQFLADIVVTEMSGVASTSRTALSAVTIDSAAPEPSTILLVLAGFGAIGAARLRRK